MTGAEAAGDGGSLLQTDGRNGEALTAGRSAASLTPNVPWGKLGPPSTLAASVPFANHLLCGVVSRQRAKYVNYS